MCNCGKKRQDYSSVQSTGWSAYKNTVTSQSKSVEDVYFEYTGVTALSVTGRISGKRYRFGHPGNIQPIDYRDAAGLMTVPVLKKVVSQ